MKVYKFIKYIKEIITGQNTINYFIIISYINYAT